MNDKPYWKLLKNAGEELTEEGYIPFTRSDLIQKVLEIDPKANEDTLNPMIQGMTVNLKGGSPGCVGKNIFKSVGRGKFKLNNSDHIEKDDKKHQNKADEEREQRPNETINYGSKGSTNESDIRNHIMQILYQNIGEKGSWKGSNKNAKFLIRIGSEEYLCHAEKSLTYTLPDQYELNHENDILIEDRQNEKYVSIEIKHKSAVTDQFKCRSYDMNHLKNEYGEDILGIMVYVKSNRGISPGHAEKICHSFDEFFHIPSNSRHNPKVWEGLIKTIKNFLND